MQGDLF